MLGNDVGTIQTGRALHISSGKKRSTRRKGVSMNEKLKIAFFAAYFLLAPLAGYYWNNHVWSERIARERGRIIEEQINASIDAGGGMIHIPSGIYIIGAGKE